MVTRMARRVLRGSSLRLGGYRCLFPSLEAYYMQEVLRSKEACRQPGVTLDLGRRWVMELFAPTYSPQYEQNILLALPGFLYR